MGQVVLKNKGCHTNYWLLSLLELYRWCFALFPWMVAHFHESLQPFLISYKSIKKRCVAQNIYTVMYIWITLMINIKLLKIYTFRENYKRAKLLLYSDQALSVINHGVFSHSLSTGWSDCNIILQFTVTLWFWPLIAAEYFQKMFEAWKKKFRSFIPPRTSVKVFREEQCHQTDK